MGVQPKVAFQVLSHEVLVKLDPLRGHRTLEQQGSSCDKVHEIAQHIVFPVCRIFIPPQANQSDHEMDCAQCTPLVCREFACTGASSISWDGR